MRRVNQTMVVRRGSVRRLRAWWLALCAVVVVAGCGGEPASGGSAETGWPLTLDVPAVLGYAAGRSEGALERGLLELGGWQLTGTDPSRPEVLLLLDATVLGAPLGLALPVTDPAAFEASVAVCRDVVPVGDGRYRLTLPPDHPLRLALLAAQAGPSLGSLADAMRMLDQLAPLSTTLSLSFHEGYALLVPSFEAGLVARRVLSELPLERALSGALVFAIDVERVRDTFHDEIEARLQQARALLTGAQMAGLAGMLASAAAPRGAGPLGGGLPVSGEFLWTLLDMLSLDDVGAVGLQVQGLGLAEDGSPQRSAGQPLEVQLRLRRLRASSFTRVMDSLRPVPVPERGAALAADPGAFRQALVTWCAPLGPLAKGEGPPAERWLARLGELLAPWSGRAELHLDRDASLFALGLEPGQRFDQSGWLRWSDELLDAAGVDPTVGLSGLLGAREVMVVSRDDSLLAFDSESDPDVVDTLAARLFGELLPATGPVLRLAAEDATLDLSVQGLDQLLSLVIPVEGGELR